MIKDLLYLAPEIILLLTNLLMMATKNNKCFSMFCLLGSIFIVINNFSHNELILFNQLIIVNPTIDVIKIAIIGFGAIVLLMVDSQDYKDELPILIIFSMMGTMVVASANDFISLYMGIELQSLSSYVLASFNKNKKNDLAAESGMKYFILGAIASGIMIYGISIIYGHHGNTKLSSENINDIWTNVGTVLIISGLAFKMSLAPFHIWVADVYQGSSTIAAAFFAAVPKLGLMLSLTRIMEAFVISDALKSILLSLAILSVLASAFGGLVQKNIKRLIAFSSIGHLGYVVLGLCNGHLDSAIIYILIYSFGSLGIFAFLLMIESHDISSLSGLARTHPKLSACLSILMLSMAGLPPFAGFFIKFRIISAMTDQGLIWQSVLVLAASAVSAYYYIRVIKVMYFDAPSQFTLKVCYSHSRGAILLISVAINSWFFLFQSQLISFLKQIVLVH